MAVVVVIIAVVMIAAAMFFLPFMASEVLHGSMVPFPFGMFVVIGYATSVPISHVVVTIYMPTEVFSAMKPWSSADEDAVRKPLRAIVAIGSA